MPPFRLKRELKAAEEEGRGGERFQQLSWETLRKSLNGLVNKATRDNLRALLPELFAENLVRGRGLLCRALMRSQVAAPTFTPVYAGLVAVVNSKFPETGELLLHRLVLQFRRAYRRNDKPVCSAAMQFLGHLANQRVASEFLVLEILALLLEQPSADSVELAVELTKACGLMLQEASPRGLHSVFERLRGILHDGDLERRAQFLIEGLFAVRKGGFEGHPPVPPELDLIEESEQVTHDVGLEDDIEARTGLDAFHFDPDYEEHEAAYESVKREILGDESDGEDESEDGSDEGGKEGDAGTAEGQEAGNGRGGTSGPGAEGGDASIGATVKIHDQTETNLVNLRRTIYLTIMSSLDFEEAGHKLMKIKIPRGQEIELCTMILECCSQERSYVRYYGLLGQRFCLLRREYQEGFQECFARQYETVHRLETNKLRNVAKFFANLLSGDALPWSVLNAVRLTEQDTTSSSRIFVKIVFQELCEQLGLNALNKRFRDPEMVSGGHFDGIFPKDTARNVRFSINFFTSIGLGGLTDDMRKFLKEMPKAPPPPTAPAEGPRRANDSDSYSYSYSGSYSYSYSGSYSYSYSYSSYSYSSEEVDRGKKGKGRVRGDDEVDSPGRKRARR